MDDLFDAKSSKDFDIARFKAFINKIISKIKNDKNELLSFEDVKKYLMSYNQSYKGVQTIKIDDIVGSEGRYGDFDKKFLPLQDSTKDRWENIDKAHYKNVELPPIEVYKIGNYYFVKDGNHRVSVAREKGMKYIDAEVIEIKTKIPLKKDMNYDEIILQWEKMKFYEETRLKELFPDADIKLTKFGRYDILLNQIKGHHHILEMLSSRKIEWQEAVKSWYKTVYLPLINTIREIDIMKNFPKHTESDLYIWILNHWKYLNEKYDTEIDTRSAAINLKKRASKDILNILKLKTVNEFKTEKNNLNDDK